MARAKSFGLRGPVQDFEAMEMTVNDQVFHVLPTLSGVKLLNLIRAMDGSDEDTNSATAMLSFIESAVVPADRERCMKYLLEGEPPVELTTITEMITWLIEEYSGKDSKSSPSSANGSPTNGSTNMAAPASPELTLPPNGWMPPPSSVSPIPYSGTA